MFREADSVLGFPLSEVMFLGTEEELKRTDVTQPAIFLHSVALARALDVTPDFTAGHSLGEFSALVAAGVLTFESALRLVAARARAMQRACEIEKGTMAAIIGLDDDVVERICSETDGVVVAANYNCPGQLAISGSIEAVDAACARAREAGARRALVLPVGGAFHSPLMAPASEELRSAIEATRFMTPACPVFQNVDAMPHTDPDQIKRNLVSQLTSPVRWTQTVRNMSAAGCTSFVELGPGKVLQGLIRRALPDAEIESKSCI